MEEADELWAGGGGTVRDAGTMDGPELGKAGQFVLVEADCLVGARRAVIARGTVRCNCSTAGSTDSAIAAASRA